MQDEKKKFRDFHAELTSSKQADPAATARKFLAEELEWHGPHPINAVRGRNAFVDRVWRPLAEAFDGLERQEDILMQDEYQGATWVAAIGHYHGTFTRDWLGIPATGEPASIRFGEFARFEEDRITEVRTLFDLVAFCRECGIDLLPPDAGSTAAVPAPETADGVILAPQNPEIGHKSLEIVNDMIGGLLEFDGENLHSMRMERFWTGNMRWYGPAGIGTTYGLDGFQKHHQGPFLKAFPDRYAGPHAALLAEGDYVSVTGWPSVIGTHKGEYLGVPATGKKVEMRVMDFWRCEDGLLAENWVLIDMIDLFLQLGRDLLGEALARVE